MFTINYRAACQSDHATHTDQ